MKNYLMFALLIGAASTVAFGQTVTVNCPEDECHVAPFFKGEGGFIGEVAAGHDEVTFTLVCGSVNMSGTAEPSGGIVAQLLSMDNGLACASGGSVEIQGLEDGGWYWINDSRNSAVASLVAKDALGNDMVMPTDPGSSDITLESMKGAATTILKQASTGRIGILHHVLPEPEAEPADMCGPYYWSSHGRYYQNSSSCMLGDGSTKIVLTADTTDSLGRVQRVSGSVYRRVASAANNEVRVGFSLWGADGQGHVTDKDSPTSADVIKGWDIATPRGHAAAEPFAADYVVALIQGEGHNLVIADADIRIDPARKVTETVPGEGTQDVKKMVPVTHEAAGTAVATPDPGAGQRAACASTADNSATCAAIVEDVGTRRLEEGYYMGESAAMQCRQSQNLYADDDTRDGVIYFKPASGSGSVAVLASANYGTAALNLGSGATLAEQETWVRAWHSNARERISILQIVDDNGTSADTTDDVTRDIPEVVCEMIETTVKEPVPDSTRTIIENGGIIIGPGATTHCRSGRSDVARLFIGVQRSDVRSRNTDILPPASTGAKVGGVNYAATTVLNVMCPSSSANQAHHASLNGGVDLVPHTE